MAELLTLKEVFEAKKGFGTLPAYCTHCGITVLYQSTVETPALDQHRIKLEDEFLRHIAVGRCPSCSMFAVGAVTLSPLNANGPGHFLWPLGQLPDKAPPGVDADAKRAYDEARAVFSLSPRGAAVLARRALQRVIREKLGIEKRTLFDEIAEAIKLPDLSKPTREAIDHVREFGNWGAHPLKEKADPAETLLDVTPEQARYTIQVLELVFHDLYELPVHIAAMKAQIGK